MWENYHDAERRLSILSTSGGGGPSAGAAIIRMEPKGDLQLHPNYGAACQVSLDSFDLTTHLAYHSCHQVTIVLTLLFGLITFDENPKKKTVYMANPSPSFARSLH